VWPALKRSPAGQASAWGSWTHQPTRYSGNISPLHPHSGITIQILQSRDSTIIQSRDSTIIQSRDSTIIQSRDSTIIQSRDSTIIQSRDSTYHNTIKRQYHNTIKRQYRYHTYSMSTATFQAMGPPILCCYVAANSGRFYARTYKKES
jgi:hypothetical protein